MPSKMHARATKSQKHHPEKKKTHVSIHLQMCACRNSAVDTQPACVYTDAGCVCDVRFSVRASLITAKEV